MSAQLNIFDESENHLALADQVALRMDNWNPEQGCPAWIESADRQCGKPNTEGYLCKRHHTVAVRRYEDHLLRERTKQERREAWREKNLPLWRAELAKVDAEIERRDQPVVRDRAVGGVVHPSIRTRQRALISDSNVKLMAALWRKHEELRRLIGRDK